MDLPKRQSMRQQAASANNSSIVRRYLGQIALWPCATNRKPETSDLRLPHDRRYTPRLGLHVHARHSLAAMHGADALDREVDEDLAGLGEFKRRLEMLAVLEC
jgi:hypothetical protein